LARRSGWLLPGFAAKKSRREKPGDTEAAKRWRKLTAASRVVMHLYNKQARHHRAMHGNGKPFLQFGRTRAGAGLNAVEMAKLAPRRAHPRPEPDEGAVFRPTAPRCVASHGGQVH
jgi:hypothetical protein